MIVECCKCRMIRIEGEWLSADALGGNSTTAVSHTYCPPCLDVELTQFATHQEHQKAYGYSQ